MLKSLDCQTLSCNCTKDEKGNQCQSRVIMWCRETDECRPMFSLHPHHPGLPERHPTPLVCKRLTSHHAGLWCSCWWQRRTAEEKDTRPLREEKVKRRMESCAVIIKKAMEETTELKTQLGWCENPILCAAYPLTFPQSPWKFNTQHNKESVSDANLFPELRRILTQFVSCSISFYVLSPIILLRKISRYSWTVCCLQSLDQ